jgi:NADH:ubiquinone oxidoreductase subunit E
MSLPIAGGRGPTRPPTHNELDLDKLSKLGLELDDIADDDAIRLDDLEELAQTLGVDESALLAAAALVTDYQVAREADVQFVVCAGGCQKWGALDVLDQLVRLRRDRLDAGQPAFDIATRGCLDRCQDAAAVLVNTPDGTATITQASPDTIASAVTDACGD